MNRYVMPIVFILLLFVDKATATQRMALAEFYTNTSCTNCPAYETALDQIIQAHPDAFATVRYHVSFPSSSDPFYRFNISDNNARAEYYNVAGSGVPYMKIDGIITPTSYTSYWYSIQNRDTVSSPLSISLSGEYNPTARNGNLHISIEATSQITATNLVVQIALVESNIYYSAPNGVNIHNQTLRFLLPNASGTPLTIANGQTVYLDQAFSCTTLIVTDNSEFIVWVQSQTNKEVLQASKIGITNLTVGIEDCPALPSVFGLSQNYPNPFNAKTIIDYSIGKNSDVKLSVYDLAGRLVNTLYNGAQEAGHYQVTWDGKDRNGNPTASGVYFYRLEAEGKNVTRRMVMLK